jgi:dolichol kinase
MSDAALSTLWMGVLFGGLCVAGGLSRAGLPRTHVRDLLHVGAGVWPLGWPYWRSPLPPICIACGALVVMALVPLLARRVEWLARVQSAVSDDDERWSGLVLYALSFAIFTAVGLLAAPFPAAAALLALALGDGLGGAAGLAFGRHRFSLAAGKQKSLEGSLAVAVFASLGVMLAAHWFDAPSGWGLGLAAGVVAALAEAISPRATDNLVLPAVVWAMLVLSPRVS